MNANERKCLIQHRIVSVPEFKKILRWLAYVLVVGGIAVGFLHSLTRSRGLENSAMDAAPLASMGVGAWVFGVVSENFTWARTERHMPTWLGRLLFAIIGSFFIFGAWDNWHQ
jgi:hypothetical protein